VLAEKSSSAISTCDIKLPDDRIARSISALIEWKSTDNMPIIS
jgi:hypothetical protein